MKIDYSPALAMLVILALAAGFAYAGVDQNAQYNYDYGYTRQMPPGSMPASTGVGPTMRCPAGVPCPSNDLCNVVPQGTCGAFCEAGQAAPGWPYNWCSAYWLRPNTNF